MLDFLKRVKGVRVHAGRVKRELVENFLAYDPKTSKFKHIDYQGAFIKMTGSNTSGVGAANISQRNNAAGGRSHTYKVVARGRVTGTLKGYLECSYRNTGGTEVGTRQTIEFDILKTDQTIKLENVAIPSDAVTTDVIVGIKTSAGGTGTLIITEIAVIDNVTGANIVRDGNFDSDPTGTLTNWTTYRSGSFGGNTTASCTFLLPDFVANHGNATFRGEPSDDILGGMICDLDLKLSNFREINWIIEGFSLNDNVGLSSALAIKNSANTAGVEFKHENGDATTTLIVYHADGTKSETEIKYNMLWGGEARRRRNLSLTVFPRSKFVYILEDDQVIYRGKHADLVVDQIINPMAYFNNYNSTQKSLYVSQAKLQLIHN
jgi:hypothetical protein